MLNNQFINWKRILPIIVVAVLLIGNVFFGGKYFSSQIDFRQAQTALEKQRFSSEVLRFTKLFIVKVLKTEKEVDFETRLKLETAVRDLNDQEILTQWQKFVESENEAEAQKNVKDLLETLINKISAQ